MELETLSHGSFVSFRFVDGPFAHGFIGADLNFRSSWLEASAARFLPALAIRQLFLLKQVHSAEVISVESGQLPPGGGARIIGEGDGIFIADMGPLEGRGCAFGIRTADCLPILMRAGNSCALVHAGWRGLAAGVIERALWLLDQESCGLPLEVLIGPAAGTDSYEVGAEVIRAMGGKASFRAHENKATYWFSLQETAHGSITENWAGEVSCTVAPICTIADRRFHSYRRQGVDCGSNLSFIII